MDSLSCCNSFGPFLFALGKSRLWYNRLMANITISKKDVQKKDGVVVLSLKEYQRLLKAAAPTEYLTGKAAEDLDKLYDEGMKDYKAGRTRKIRSLADLR